MGYGPIRMTGVTLSVRVASQPEICFLSDVGSGIHSSVDSGY